jgi:wobble nucleotide-excising tRNase
MVTVSNIRLLKNAAVLAERKAATPNLGFKRYNLIYGFNGVGKSTLSRMFAAVQSGKVHAKLPANCTFELELSNGKRLAYPKSHCGLEKTVCVFNGDFIAENLRWDDGVATPVFYISSDQAEAAAQLKKDEADLPTLNERYDGEAKVVREREKAFSDFKRITARTIAEALRHGKRYEASQYSADVEKIKITSSDVLAQPDLEAAIATCARSEAPAKVSQVAVPAETIMEVIEAAKVLGSKSIGTIIVDGLEQHPQMVPWVKEGHAYHVKNHLAECLYCGEKIPEARKEILTKAFDAEFANFVIQVNTAHQQGSSCLEALAIARAAIPAAAQLSAEFQPPFKAAAPKLVEALEKLDPFVEGAVEQLRERKAVPTTVVEDTLPSLDEVRALVAEVAGCLSAVNGICEQHSKMVDDFIAHQETARDKIRRHYIAVNAEEYGAHLAAIGEAESASEAASGKVAELRTRIGELRARVQQHGPAADKINALVRSYLGHGELTIVAVSEGFELHRNSAIVTGAPSEGEKTAIALCYFLSTLEADDRKVKDLVIVLDDPISSLDTKAMNFACALIRNRLSAAAQLFVLTHNQHCMNEFKKEWKGRATADPATASLKFIDVKVEAAGGGRSSSLVDLPKHLREYESEYHYLFEKVLALETVGEAHFDYAFMMPNVLRRVLEIFLAFKVPRSGNIGDKLRTLCEKYPNLNKDRLMALERLSHVESHSDNLDDLITQSSMTIEESRDANAALIHLMSEVDEGHLAGLRKYCQ